MLRNELMLNASGGGVVEGISIISADLTYEVYVTDVSTNTQIFSGRISKEMQQTLPPLTIGNEYKIDAAFEWYNSISFTPSDAARVTSSYEGGNGYRDGYVRFILTRNTLTRITVDFETSA